MDSKLRQHLALGRKHYSRGDYETAEKHLRAVVKVRSHFADVHNMLGVIAYTSGRYNRARDHFEMALQRNPHYAEAAVNLSLCYNDLGRYGDAREVYTRALRGRPGEEQSLDLQPRESLGAGMEKLDALVHGRIANLHAELGSAYAEIGQTQRAIEEYREAIRICPHFRDFHVRLSVLHRTQGALEESKRMLSDLLAAHPDYLHARVELGITLMCQGQLGPARDEWDRVLEQDPTNESAQFYLRETTRRLDTSAA